ncbi:outer membrane protein [Escherichia coli]|uniref:Outer membrane protein n=1 Tax=Escherichia coli TaxID=562 RepID=A0A377KC81_ECOLX|nr:outer membrane protein [Escherichia coli]
MSASSVKPLNVQLPAITLILFALCVGIFCYLAQWMSYEEVDQSALIHLGANVASLTLSDESWRLLSSVFLHSSFSHLLMNMFALLVVGTVAETDTGEMATPDYLVILRHLWWADQRLLYVTRK